MIVLSRPSFVSQANRPIASRSHTGHSGPAGPFRSGNTPLQVDRVQSYVTRLLRGELPRGTNSQTTLPHPMSHTSYGALLPTMWSLISTPEQDKGPNTFFLALMDHALKVSSGSAIKRDTIEFVGLLAMVSTRNVTVPKSGFE